MERVDHPRFYETERGYQGELIKCLNMQFRRAMRAGGYIVEQEHQKTLQEHNIRTRPDIIVHQPFDASKHQSRREGNFAVIELKLGANRKTIRALFDELVEFMNVLDYPIGVIVNIDARTVPFDPLVHVSGRYVFTYATSLQDESPSIVGFDA